MAWIVQELELSRYIAKYRIADIRYFQTASRTDMAALTNINGILNNLCLTLTVVITLKNSRT